MMHLNPELERLEERIAPCYGTICVGLCGAGGDHDGDEGHESGDGHSEGNSGNGSHEGSNGTGSSGSGHESSGSHSSKSS